MKSLPSASTSLTLKIYSFPSKSVSSSPVQFTLVVPSGSSFISVPGTASGSPPSICLYSLNHTVGLGSAPFIQIFSASASPFVGIIYLFVIVNPSADAS